MANGKRLIVGDVVNVGKGCLGNPPGSRAVVVEVYDRAAFDPAGGVGVMLLFPNGHCDGFSSVDREIFQVLYVEHCPAVADYVFTGTLELDTDFVRGRFEAVWDR